MDGRVVDQIGIPWHFGPVGLATGDSANVLTAHVGDALVPDLRTLWLWLEVGLGAVVPLILLAFREVRNRAAGLFWCSLCVIAGVLLNRLNVSLIGMETAAWQETYFPSWMEFAITAGIISAGLLGFCLAVRHLPVYGDGRASVSQRTA